MTAMRKSGVILMIVLLAFQGACDAGGSRAAEAENALRVIDEKLPRIEERFDTEVVDRHLIARDMLAEHGRVPEEHDPFSLLAVVASTEVPFVIAMMWLQNGFGVIGVVVEDIDGRRVEVEDAGALRDDMRNIYGGRTLMRQADILLINHGESRPDYPREFSTPGGRSRVVDVQLPEDFVREGMKMGLIADDGTVSDLIPVVSAETNREND